MTLPKLHGNWKTTAAGGSAVLAMLVSTLRLLLDGKPETTPDWDLVIPIFCAGLVGLFARDKDVASEQTVTPIVETKTKTP